MSSANASLEQNIRSFYNDVNVAYSGEQVSDIWLNFVGKHFLEYLPLGSYILDIGCGKGELVRKLINKGYQVTGLDISDGMLEFARKKIPNGRFMRDDILSLELPPTFNAVVASNNVFNHILNLDDLTKAFQNIYSALLENGWFVFDSTEGSRVLDGDSPIENPLADGDFGEDYAWLERYTNNTPDGKSYQYQRVTFQLLNGQWQRSESVCTIQGYSKAEVQFALEKAGFTKVTIYDLTKDKDFPTHFLEDLRMAYVARKL
ncbi:MULTISPECIES: class I SAM-dependent methyltransferase [Nostocales]|uniref:Methyltransferase n=3 Tax=Nostocales TaxID=1161 RepID=A0A0C1RCM6_9CYAN|nr:class I SAM-dependent methyltransferase [Tolypothrix bouteillei]KAF3885895.1 class I SAM-dependent methyltransferase [Tolypothrix bouteillei VB521301]